MNKAKVPTLGKLPVSHNRNLTDTREDITSRVSYQSPFKKPSDSIINYDDPRKTIAVDDEEGGNQLTDVKGQS